MILPTSWLSGISCPAHWVGLTVMVLGIVAHGVWVIADDDQVRPVLPTTRSPGARSADARTPAAPTRPSSAPDRSSPENGTPGEPMPADARSSASIGDADLPTIVTPGEGRRTVVVEGPPRPIVPMLRSRPANPNVAFDPSSPWRFETLVLHSETTYRGLLLRVSATEVEFAHISQHPGKPMSAMVRIIPRRDVQRFEPLPPAQLDVLAARFRTFQQRATIEARRMETITLRPVENGASRRLVYEGQSFQLISSADEESTRRCIVRIEQIFSGFRQLVPPRVAPRSRLRIVLFGTRDEFRGQLRRWKLDIANPAFYAPRQNMIAAGGDLSRFGDQLAEIRRNHEQLLAAFEGLEEDFQRQLADVTQKMVAGGFQRQEIKTELALRRTRWREEHLRLKRDIQEANRRNDALFVETTSGMLKRLYHEGFHAYLENFVFPQRDFHLDRWLHEGLAQIFESAQFDLDVLRLDAPDPVLLAKLQQDLAMRPPLRLVDLLSASDATFLVRHAADETDRRYLYAWGVAYYLAFERGLLDGDALARFAVPRKREGGERPKASDVLARTDPASGPRVTVQGAAVAPAASAVERFETLVAAELDEFEDRWRAFMLNLPSASG